MYTAPTANYRKIDARAYVRAKVRVSVNTVICCRCGVSSHLSVSGCVSLLMCKQAAVSCDVLHVLFYDCRQVSHSVETDSWWVQLRCASEVSPRPWTLCLGRNPFVWWPVCAVRLLGSHSTFVGPEQVLLHSKIWLFRPFAISPLGWFAPAPWMEVNRPRFSGELARGETAKWQKSQTPS